MSNSRLIEALAQPRDAILMPLAFRRARFQVTDAGQRAGSDVVKMKPEAKLRMKSQIVADAAT